MSASLYNQKENPLRNSFDNRNIPIKAKYFGNEIDMNINQAPIGHQNMPTPKTNQEYKEFLVNNNFVDRIAYK